MKRKKFLTAIVWTTAMAAHAQNPIIQTCFTPDPAPFVHGDTVYLFTDHDEDDAQYFKMKDWLLFSTTDMVEFPCRPKRSNGPNRVITPGLRRPWRGTANGTGTWRPKIPRYICME